MSRAFEIYDIVIRSCFWINHRKCQIEMNESVEKNYQLRIPKSKKCFTEPNLFKIRASKMTLLIQIFLIISPNQQRFTYDEDNKLYACNSYLKNLKLKLTD